ncbi:flippase-like domain-containing protein [candidate division WOR-3 bacterium]|nr:flippase-like domain-containing protein [candidate division WOR-3 bacterium]
MGKRYQILIGILLSLLFLWLAFRKVDFREVGFALSNANYLYFVLAFFLSGAGFLLRAYRWKIMLSPIKDIRFGKVFSALTIGFMANGILPMRLGEIVRAIALGYDEKISRSAALATIVIERMFDIFVLLFLFAIFLMLIPFPPQVKKVSLVVFAIGLLAIIFLLFLISKPELVCKFFDLLPIRIGQKFQKTFLYFIEGLKIIKEKKLVVLVTLLSFCLWAYIAMINFTVFQVLKIDLPLYAAFIVMITVCLGISIPSAPGFIGTFHYFAILGLSVFNISKDTALSFAILSHLIGFLPVVLIGFFCLQRMGLSLRKVTQS